MTGFFSESSFLKDKPALSTVPKCSLCGLYKKCKSKKMEPSGKGKKRILIVGEAPGANEDKKGTQFIGSSGDLLKRMLKKVGIKMRRDCILTNALICRPPDNATPTDDQIKWCNPNLQKTIKENNPDIIITVGKPALESVLFGIWEEKLGAMAKWVGWRIPLQKYNTWLIPTYHPSYVMRQVEEVKGGTPIQQIFKDHLKLAVELKGKPYKKSPNWEKKITVLYDKKEIVDAIDFFIHKGGAISFDFETNMLKPDSKDGDIITASICWRGKKTIAFPWRGEEVLEAFRRLMRANNPKVSHNLKFEDRWTESKLPQKLKGQVAGFILGITGINNWAWDTMVNAHLIDNRPDICSLEFQALVVLGLAPYSAHISPFLTQKLSYGKNRIKEVDMKDLLIYNGLDSLVCMKLMKRQRQRLGLKSL